MTWSMWAVELVNSSAEIPEPDSELSQREANKGTPCRRQALPFTTGEPPRQPAFRTAACGFSRNDLARSTVVRSEKGPPYVYDLVSAHPSRPAKGLRAALSSATCGALGGSPRQALNSAVAIELLHNAFLIHDDVQDGSELRCGRPTLFREHAIPIAMNLGNATSMPALRRLMKNRAIGVRQRVGRSWKRLSA